MKIHNFFTIVGQCRAAGCGKFMCVQEELKDEPRISVVDNCLIDNCDGTNLKNFMLHVSKLHSDGQQTATMPSSR